MTPFIYDLRVRILETLEKQIENSATDDIKKEALKLYADIAKTIIECGKEIILSDNQANVDINKTNADFNNRQGEIHNENLKIQQGYK